MRVRAAARAAARPFISERRSLAQRALADAGAALGEAVTFARTRFKRRRPGQARRYARRNLGLRWHAPRPETHSFQVRFGTRLRPNWRDREARHGRSRWPRRVTFHW